MRLSAAKKQTVYLTSVNGIVRALGLLMRVVLSRMLGAEVMGVMELAQSLHMVAITPLTSGLPAAISRMTARAAPAGKQLPLLAGLWLVRAVSLVMIPALWLLTPLLARLLGDARVLPSLWFTAPCILILGYSAAYNGYCYGIGAAHLPANSELLEQVGRLAVTILLLRLLPHLTAAWSAAIPMAATMSAELMGLLYIARRLRFSPDEKANFLAKRTPVFRLAFPTTLNRLTQTILRSLTAVLIPYRLQQSGLSAVEATARLGMFNGMVTPILMLPCIFTSALAMVALPRIAKAEEQPAELKRLLLNCLMGCIPFSLLCAAAIYAAAPFLANVIYRQPELTALFQSSAPLTLLMAVGHLAASALSALGQQRWSFYASLAVSAVTVCSTWFWTANPALRIQGVIRAQYVSQLLSIALSALLFVHWFRGQSAATADGKSA